MSFANGFETSAGRALLTSAAPADTVAVGGWTYDRDTSALYVAPGGTPVYYAGGFGFTAAGAMCVVDASAGLPAGTVYVSGLPVSDGALCIDASGAVDHYVSGAPVTVTGALATTGVSFADYYRQESSVDHYAVESGSGAYILE